MAELAAHVSERHRDIALFHHDYRWKNILGRNRNVVGRLTLKIHRARHGDHVSLELEQNPRLHNNSSTSRDGKVRTNLEGAVRSRPSHCFSGGRLQAAYSGLVKKNKPAAIAAPNVCRTRERLALSLGEAEEPNGPAGPTL